MGVPILLKLTSLVTALVSLVALLPSASVSDSAAADATRQEARRRNGAMVEAGFNLTHGWRIPGGEKPKPIRLELAFPEGGTHSISLWFDTSSGEVTARFVGPEGRKLADLAAKRGEWTVERDLPAGGYRLEVDPGAGATGEVVFGVKGAVVAACPLPPGTIEIAASLADGFSWPYLLFVPEEASAGRLLVAPNNTGFASTDPALIRASGSCQASREVPFASRLGAPMLVPLFPRPELPGTDEENLYLHALTRPALSASKPPWRRVDLQLLAMVKDARARLTARGLRADGRILLRGFSASGSFVDRFALLHPGEVLAVACGSPGGWPTAPVAEEGGEKLPYPVGLGDLASLGAVPPEPEKLRRVRFLFQLGDRDANDAVPFRDSFSKSDQELVDRRFGATPVARWPDAERLHREAGLDARFVLYPGVGHEVSAAMETDAEAFFREAMAADRRP